MAGLKRVHDRAILDALDAIDPTPFEGRVWRVTPKEREALPCAMPVLGARSVQGSDRSASRRNPRSVVLAIEPGFSEMAVVLDIDDLISLGSPVAKQGPRVGQSPPPQPKEQIVMTMDERITLDPAILAGKPIVRGTRLSVEFIIGLMADGWREADILANYPGLAHQDITACLAYARDVLQSEKVHPSAA